MPGAGATRFPIRFDRVYGFVSSVLFLWPRASYVEVRGASVEVRMAWAFLAKFPRAAITSAHVSELSTLSRGVHGFGGRWLVNGSGRGLVQLILSPQQRGRVLGFPVRLRELLVSVEDPAELIRALGR